MARASEPQPHILVVVTGFGCALGVFRQGELIDADHPAVRKYPDHFGPVIVQHPAKRTQPSIEQATAAPGEKRDA
jgi:hypothetical protein